MICHVPLYCSISASLLACLQYSHVPVLTKDVSSESKRTLREPTFKVHLVLLYRKTFEQPFVTVLTYVPWVKSAVILHIELPKTTL